MSGTVDMYLVDTNVISELRKGTKADPGVVDLLKHSEDRICLSVLVIGELRSGIESLRRRGDHTQAAGLEDWLDTVLDAFGTRILTFDLTCAEAWGKLLGINRQNPVDKQLAATALVYELTVVTRNTSHFHNTGVPVLNPFTADAQPGPRLV